MIYEVSLSNGATQLDLLPQNGFVLQRLNLGYPQARVISSRRAGINGSVDNTYLFGERTITANVGMAPEIVPDMPGEMALLDELMAWMSPDQRYYLYVKNQASTYRRFKVRPNSANLNMNAESYAEFNVPTLQWIAYEGIAESAEAKSSSISTSTLNETGRVYDKTFDHTYPASPAIGQKVIVNEGSANAWPILTFYGPITGAGLLNVTTGKLFRMKSTFSLLTGEYLVVNMREGTVLLNGVAGNSRYSLIDFPINDWWQLVPGPNLLQFVTTTSSAPAQVLVEWRDSYL